MKNLTAMRRRAGLTVAQLAERLHYTRAAVYLWEAERTSPSADLLPTLATVLGCSIDDLFREDDIKNEEGEP